MAESKIKWYYGCDSWKGQIIMECADCSKKKGRLRVVEFSATLPNGEHLSDIIDDRCPDCRDDYGVIFDALTSAMETSQGGVRQLPDSIKR